METYRCVQQGIPTGVELENLGKYPWGNLLTWLGNGEGVSCKSKTKRGILKYLKFKDMDGYKGKYYIYVLILINYKYIHIHIK